MTPPSPVTLVVGAPEGTAEGDNVGTRQIVQAFEHEGLTVLGRDGRALPQLAESWAWDSDGRRLRVRVRNDVTYHDGTPLTAEGVAVALSDARDDPGLRLLYPGLGDVTAIDAGDGGEIVISLASPNRLLPEELDVPIGKPGTGTGTGPYRARPGASGDVVLERHEQYHAGRPAIERLIIRPFSTMRTAWASLLRGELDVVDVEPHGLRFAENASVQRLTALAPYLYMVALNNDVPPLDRTEVRRALNLAIDRDRLVRRVLEDTSQLASDPVWPELWAHDATLEPFHLDLPTARQLLDRVGLPVPAAAGATGRRRSRFTFTALVPAGIESAERLALEVQRDLFALDIDMQLESVPVAEFSGRVQERRFEAVVLSVISGPTIGRPMLFWRAPNRAGGLNVFGYANDDVERLYAGLRSPVDEQTFRASVSGLQRAFRQDPPAIFLGWERRTRLVNRRFNVSADRGRDPLYSMWKWTLSAEGTGRDGRE